MTLVKAASSLKPSRSASGIAGGALSCSAVIRPLGTSSGNGVVGLEREEGRRCLGVAGVGSEEYGNRGP
jgi:hypothetical protein